MMPFEAEFKYERDTKRCYRFQEDSQNPKVGTLYVQKWAFEKQPSRIKVTVEVME
jgi:hypothetical protein